MGGLRYSRKVRRNYRCMNIFHEIDCTIISEYKDNGITGSEIHYNSILACSLRFYRNRRIARKLYPFSIRPHNNFTKVSNRSIV